jgi:hypothetical protein
MPSDTNMANHQAALAFVQVTTVVARFEALWYRSYQEERDLATPSFVFPLQILICAESSITGD